MVDELAAMHPGAEVIVADCLDADDMIAAFDGIDAAFVITPDVLDEQTAMTNVAAAINASRTLVRLIRLIGDPPGLRDESQVTALPGFDDEKLNVQHLQAQSINRCRCAGRIRQRAGMVL